MVFLAGDGICPKTGWQSHKTIVTTAQNRNSRESRFVAVRLEMIM
jgi:hypothetical protein